MTQHSLAEQLRLRPRPARGLEDHPWGENVAKVGKKVFVFFGLPDAEHPFGMTVKLPDSYEMAMSLPWARNPGYRMDRGRWVWLQPPDDAPLDMLTEWIEESATGRWRRSPSSPRCLTARTVLTRRARQGQSEPQRRNQQMSEGHDPEQAVGTVTHYFGHLSVAAVTLTDTLRIGDRIHITGHTTDFEQTVDSMEVEHSKSSPPRPVTTWHST